MKDKQNKEEQLGCNTTVYEIHVKSGLHVAQPQCFEQMGLHVHTLYSLVSLFQPPPPSQLLLSRGVLLPFVAYTVLVGGHSARTGMFWGWVVLLDYCCLKQGQDSKPSGSSTPSFLGFQYLHLNSSETGRSCMYCQTTAMLNKTSSDNFYRIFYFYY